MTKPRSCYSVSAKGPKKPNKLKRMLQQKKTLENRVKVEGETKWIKNANATLEKRLKNAGLV